MEEHLLKLGARGDGTCLVIDVFNGRLPSSPPTEFSKLSELV